MISHACCAGTNSLVTLNPPVSRTVPNKDAATGSGTHSRTECRDWSGIGVGGWTEVLSQCRRVRLRYHGPGPKWSASSFGPFLTKQAYRLKLHTIVVQYGEQETDWTPSETPEGKMSSFKHARRRWDAGETRESHQGSEGQEQGGAGQDRQAWTNN